jgi:hypothetical protein
MWILIFDTG